MESSIIFSIGTALSHAKEHDLPVAVLVANEWLRGRVLAMDGHGLVLESDGFDRCVVRLEAVSAVKIDAIVSDQVGVRTPLRSAG